MCNRHLFTQHLSNWSACTGAWQCTWPWPQQLIVLSTVYILTIEVCIFDKQRLLPYSLGNHSTGLRASTTWPALVTCKRGSSRRLDKSMDIMFILEQSRFITYSQHSTPLAIPVWKIDWSDKFAYLTPFSFLANVLVAVHMVGQLDSIYQNYHVNTFPHCGQDQIQVRQISCWKASPPMSEKDSDASATWYFFLSDGMKICITSLTNSLN